MDHAQNLLDAPPLWNSLMPARYDSRFRNVWIKTRVFACGTTIAMFFYIVKKLFFNKNLEEAEVIVSFIPGQDLFSLCVATLRTPYHPLIVCLTVPRYFGRGYDLGPGYRNRGGLNAQLSLLAIARDSAARGAPPKRALSDTFEGRGLPYSRVMGHRDHCDPAWEIEFEEYLPQSFASTEDSMSSE
jgi:hypothetical protein